MRKFSFLFIVLGVLGSFLVAAPAQAVNDGEGACTPGYWKNHTDNWQEVTPGTRLADAPGSRKNPDLGFIPVNTDMDATFLDALRYKGGPGAAGAEQILLRAAAAAWLNAAHDDLGYDLKRGQIVNPTNRAMASERRARMLKLATRLDNLNNAGCPLN